MVGETIKGFKIIGLLGRGGMGDVWMAEQQIVKTRVAIKLLREEASLDQHQVQRFFNEAIAAGKIKHTGIVKIFDVGVHAGRAFLIMELLEGETLAARLRRVGRLPLGDVVEVGRQIVSILEATHAEDIIHRDLKPDNVFLVPDSELESKFRVKILDFGIAKLGIGLTGTGESMGTPGYMAPEQWTHAADVNTLTDVYALGCVTFELCCGRPPFVVKSIPVAYAQQMNDLPPRVSSLAPDLPDELDDLVARMLARSPEDRPAVCDVREALARIALSERCCSDPPAVNLVVMTTATMAPVVECADNIKRGFRSRRAMVIRLGVVMIGVALLGATRDGCRGGMSDKVPIEAPAPIRIPVTKSIEMPIKDKALPIEKPVRTLVPNKALVENPIKAPVPVEMSVEKQDKASTVSKLPVAIAAKLRRCPAGMATVPEGMFQMGSPMGTGQANEHPQHAVTLSSYCIDRMEVTVRSYERCVRAKGCPISPPTRNLPDGQEATVWAPYCNREDRPDHPINCVDWNQAETYCRWVDKRLPTEAEWEYAARGTDGRLYPWGNALPNSKLLNACGGECVEMGERELDDRLRSHRALYSDSDGYETTAPVGSFPRDVSPFGVLDLGGNVSEWTADWYGKYVSGFEVNPKGPIAGTQRSTRGGNWFFNVEGLFRSTTRIPDDPDQRRVRLGFRCARDLLPSSTR